MALVLLSLEHRICSRTQVFLSPNSRTLGKRNRGDQPDNTQGVQSSARHPLLRICRLLTSCFYFDQNKKYCISCFGAYNTTHSIFDRGHNPPGGYAPPRFAYPSSPPACQFVPAHGPRRRDRRGFWSPSGGRRCGRSWAAPPPGAPDLGAHARRPGCWYAVSALKYCLGSRTEHCLAREGKGGGSLSTFFCGKSLFLATYYSLTKFENQSGTTPPGGVTLKTSMQLPKKIAPAGP